MRCRPMFLRLAIAVAVACAIAISASTTPLTTSAQDDSVPGKPSGLSATAGDTQMRLNWSDPNDSSITGYEIWYHAQSAELVGSADNIDFGNSVAVFGDVAVVGIPEEDDGAKEDSGAVSVFARHPVTRVWESKYKLKASQTVASDQFGNSVAFDGETIVVGAPFYDGQDADGNDITDAGAAYVFSEPDDGWDNPDSTDTVDMTETAKLTASDRMGGDEFARDAVAVHGNTIVVGAYGENGTTGAAYVFTKPDTGWATGTETAKLTASDGQDGDYFGDAVAVHGSTTVDGSTAVDGDTIVVGAYGDETNTGAAYVFSKSGDDWGKTPSSGTHREQTAKLTVSDSDADGGDFFGQSVAVDGDTIVAGADGDESDAGAAYVFTKPVNGWADSNEMAKLTASDGADDDRFGWSVAIAGDTVVVGAYGDDSSKGSAYVFAKPVALAGWADWDESADTEAIHLITPSGLRDNDSFGFSVSIDGNTVVIGAPNADTAYVFDVAAWDDIADSDDETTSHIVTGLTNDVAYPFWVRAVNSGGASDPSDSVSETPTAAVYAPARALNFSARQTGVGQVELTWDAHRYPLTVVAYEFTQDVGANWPAIAGSDSGTNSHTITGLGAGDYTFAVRAVNNAVDSGGVTIGMGASSDSQSITIPDKPTAPDSFAAVAGDGHVWLGWRSPLDSTITGYQYQQGTGDWTDIPGSRAGTTFHVVTGLTNSMSYAFKVRAVNAAGGSDASDELTTTPVAASSAPAQPTDFSAEQTGDGQVELTWDASTEPLSVAGYQYTQNGGSGWTTILGSDHSTVSHTITGLPAGNYTLGVRTVNSVGATASDYHSVTVFALPGAPSGLAATAGDTQVGLTWNELGDASVNKFQVLQFPESIKLISDDRADLDELGWSVAVDGDTLVIGALGDDDTQNLSGSAYVFTRVAGGWTQAGKLTASHPKEDAGFGHAVAVHGDTIVVGAYEDDYIDPDNSSDNLTDSGAAYVFTKPATGWADMTQTARLTASDAAANDEFGTSVAVHGDTIVVGAPEEDTGARGSAYIFTRPADDWGNWSTLDADGKAGLTATLRGQLGGDRFGRSVALHGDTVVVGAYEEDDNDKGEAYVFTKSAAIGVWDDWHDKKANDATARLTASDRANRDKFGRAVAMDRDTIVIGAPYHDYDDPDNDTNDVSNSGSAYVFIKPATGGWATDTETAKLIASERAANDQVGFSVAVDGNTVVVGAHQDDSSRGSGYVFIKPATGWATDTETATLTAYDRRQNDRFGHSVAVDGDTVLVGAVGDDIDKGSAYVFGTGEWADIPGSDAGTVAHIATGLLNGPEYTFQVRAVNAAGGSDPSDELTATPAASSAPAKPKDFSAEQTGVGQVELEWTVTDPLDVTGYDYTQDGGSNWTNVDGSKLVTKSHTVNNGIISVTKSYTVTGLDSVTAYTFAVRAKNSSGAGNSSDNAGPITLDAQAAAPGGFSADAGDKQVSLSWTPGDSSITKYQLLQFEPNKLIDDDGLQDDNFGYSVAVDGDTAVIGVYHDNLPDTGANSFENAGSAYVFVRQANSGGWRKVAHLTASDGAASDEFGISVAVDEDTIVVGTHGDDIDSNGTDETDVGSAYVFVKPDTGWADGTETAKLTASDGAASDEFGISVAVDGYTILVGAHQDDHNGADAGAAYLFTRPYTGWADSHETTKLIPADGAAGDEFGISVAVDGDTAVIGANKDDDNGVDSGSAYVFTKVSGVWSQHAKLTASDGAANDEFGISVAVDGYTILVGAHQDDHNGADSGSAYVFTRPDTGWADGTETAKLTASYGEATDEFGISVAVDDDTIVIGARQDTTRNGAVYVFTEPANGWADGTETAKFTAPDGAAGDRYGHSVGASGDNVLVGAPSFDSTNDSGGTGAAYLLRVSDWTGVPGSGAATDDYNVTGLTNGVQYTFQIRGVNNAGPGAASGDSSGTPRLSPPAAPTGLDAKAGDEQVRLLWNNPMDRSITHYQYQVDNGAWTDVPGSEAATISHIVTDLSNGTTYAFRVRAVNVGGESDPAVQTATPVAQSSAPDKPTGFSAEQTGEGQVELRWDAHRYPLTVTGYQYTQNGGSDWDAISDSDSATVSYTVSGLTEGATYSFAVSAVNNAVDSNGVAIGTSESSDKVTVTLVAKPNPLFALNADAGDTQVTVKWRDRNDPLMTAYQLLQLPETKLTVNGGAANDEFGASVAIDGDTAVVGAYGDGDGAVYVFVRDAQGVWRKAATLTASDGVAGDEFGISVAVDGDTAVIGANKDDDNGVDFGSAYVFTKPVSGWADATETAKLIASDGEADDEFGISVAVSRNIVVVGARGDDINIDGTDDTDVGSAYVFVKPTTSNGWADTSGDETAKLTAIGGAPGDKFGTSVAVDGETIVVGAPGDDSDEGSAYVFVRSVTGWATGDQTAKLTASDGAAGDEFGTSVAVDGDTIVVGARGDDIDIDSDGMDETGVGSAYVFVKPTTSNGWADWDDSVNSETAKLTASDGAAGDEFGISVAVDGATIVVGSWGEDEGYTGVAVTNAGGAYVFALESGVWSEELDLFAYDGNTRNHFGWSVAVAGETVLVGSPGDNDASRVESAYLIDLAEWADLDSGDMSVSEPDDRGSRTYSRRVTGLTNDQLYVYRVRAVNIGGKRPTGEIRHATPMPSKPGKPTGLTAAAGNRRVGLSWNPSDDSSIEGYQVLHFVMSKVTATDRAEDDEFGHSVAMDDGTAVVGAPKHDANDFTNSGAAYVFTRDDAGAWRQRAKLTADDGQDDDEFGHCVAVHGDTIVVGAPQHDIGGDGNKEGAAYVFTKPANGWETATETAKLTAFDGAADDEFGHSVAVHRDTVVVGAPRHDTNTISNSGAAYVFTRDDAGLWGKEKLPGTGRVETAKLTAAVGAEFDRFGYSVAVYGTVVIVGAHFYSAQKGAVYVFTEPPNGGWMDSNESAILNAFDGHDEDQFGYSVAVDDDTVVVGARQDDSKKGSAYLFTKPSTAGGWGDWDPSQDAETAKLTASDGEKSDEFGYSVALNGDTVVIGAYSDDIVDDENGNESGSAYMFSKPGGGWVTSTETAKFILPHPPGEEEDDNFGNSVAVDGKSIIVGAPGSDADDLANDNSGSIYELGIPQWEDISPSDDTTASHTVTGLTSGVEYTLQVRAVDYVGMGPGSDSVRATPRSGGGRDNRAPSFGNISNLTRAVEENTSPGALVGGPVRASDPDGDGITYSLSGFNAFSFDIVSATGQLTVKDVLDYETKSVYQVKVLASDRRNASNSVDVTINVTNVEEAGTLVVSPEQPELGVSLTATLSDPDGLISAAAWQWSRSADGSTGWSDIAGADSNSYTPVVEDVDHYLRATITYTDGHGSGKSATAITDHQVPEGQIINTAPTFGSIDSLALNIDENAPPNTLVGFPLVALDLEEDTLTYSLSGPHAALFRIEGSNGQITVGPNTTLDYEAGPVRYTVIVSVHDGRDASGDSDTAIDDYIDVHIDVNDVDEAGAVTVSLEQPKVQTALTATLSDLDGSVTAVSWQWANSTDGVDWEDIPGATSSIYTPVDADADKYVRVTAYYTDGEGVGKQEQAVLREPVRAFSAPAAATASPEPTTAAGPATMTTPAPTPMAPPTTPSDVPSAAVVPMPASDGGVPPASTPEQVADDNGIALWLILLIAAVAAVVAVGLIIVGIRIIRAPAG